MNLTWSEETLPELVHFRSERLAPQGENRMSYRLQKTSG